MERETPGQRPRPNCGHPQVDLVADDALFDLPTEDPSAAVEVHFPPVRVRCLPSLDLTRGDCSVDGYYEPFLDPEEPQILYSGDVIAQRARFTVMHELGHPWVPKIRACAGTWGAGWLRVPEQGSRPCWNR